MENVNPIGELMQATMDNVKNMLKVDTVVGDPIYTPDGITLIPISRVSVGFGVAVLSLPERRSAVIVHTAAGMPPASRSIRSAFL